MSVRYTSSLERNDLLAFEDVAGTWVSSVWKVVVQLDSDDVYKDENTLSIMVRAFYEQNCAMVVGTYMMTDFDMNIAPGIIDHKKNGHRRTGGTMLFVLTV